MISLIIPAYNEEKRISPTLESYAKYFAKDEIIVVVNGSSDNTIGVVEEAAKKHKNIIYLNIDEAIGKGSAIIEGFKLAQGDYLCFIDADSSTEPDQVEKLYSHLKDSNYAGAIGSRWIEGAEIKKYQPVSRIVASRVYNYLVRSILGLPYKDTQCGAKIFKREPIMNVIHEISPTKWEFDVSLLYTLHKHGYKIKEIPIIWEDKFGSGLKIHKTAPKMFKALFEIRRGK